LNAILPLVPEVEDVELFSQGVRPEISIVIPARDRWAELKQVLFALSRQSAHPPFEVIVVDDGSKERRPEWLETESVFPVTVVRLAPRAKHAAWHFRAGVARNIGVQNAAAPLLLFLDSDIVVPEKFLSELMKLFEHADLIQPLRSYQDGSLNNSFWQNFQQTTRDWEQLAYKWKYVRRFAWPSPVGCLNNVGAFDTRLSITVTKILILDFEWPRRGKVFNP